MPIRMNIWLSTGKPGGGAGPLRGVGGILFPARAIVEIKANKILKENFIKTLF